jgi:hypothetical protein
VVGERVYVRDFTRSGGRPVDSPRLLLHAAFLSFAHPTRGETVRLAAPIPADFGTVLERLGGSIAGVEQALEELEPFVALSSNSRRVPARSPGRKP